MDYITERISGTRRLEQNDSHFGVGAYDDSMLRHNLYSFHFVKPLRYVLLFMYYYIDNIFIKYK